MNTGLNDTNDDVFMNETLKLTDEADNAAQGLLNILGLTDNNDICNDNNNDTNDNSGDNISNPSHKVSKCVN